MVYGGDGRGLGGEKDEMGNIRNRERRETGTARGKAGSGSGRAVEERYEAKLCSSEARGCWAIGPGRGDGF